jgi:hypothetical protein
MSDVTRIRPQLDQGENTPKSARHLHMNKRSKHGCHSDAAALSQFG